MADEKTVAEQTDAKPEGEDKETGAQEEDLDALLSEYEEGSKSEPEQQDDGKEPDLKVLAKQVSDLKNLQIEQKTREDIGKVIKDIRGELDPEIFDDTMIEAWLDAQARKNPRLSTAWQQRHQNPQQFDKVVKKLNRDFSGRFSKLPDRKTTEDREAVAAAVRGAPTSAPDDDIDADKVAQMSDVEFERYVSSLPKG